MFTAVRSYPSRGFPVFPLPCVPSAPLSVFMCAAVGVVYTPHSPGSAHPAHLPAISSSPLPACTPAR